MNTVQLLFSELIKAEGDKTWGLRRLFAGRENSAVYRISKFSALEVQAIHDLVVFYENWQCNEWNWSIKISIQYTSVLFGIKKHNFKKDLN